MIQNPEGGYARKIGGELSPYQKALREVKKRKTIARVNEHKKGPGKRNGGGTPKSQFTAV